MTGQAQVTLLADGRRLHLHHGPIDIVAQAYGDPASIRRAYRQAADRFRTILAELVAELPLLRRPMTDDGIPVAGVVARRMTAAVWPHRRTFITPMAAVAGAVADEVLAAMMADCPLARAYVNDGGDIAWHLAPGESLRAGIVANQDAPAIDGTVLLDYGMPVRGMATSGWRGRSCSLGIADAVTVLAASAAKAAPAGPARLVMRDPFLTPPVLRVPLACDKESHRGAQALDLLVVRHHVGAVAIRPVDHRALPSARTGRAGISGWTMRLWPCRSRLAA